MGKLKIVNILLEFPNFILSINLIKTVKVWSKLVRSVEWNFEARVFILVIMDKSIFGNIYSMKVCLQ